MLKSVQPQFTHARTVTITMHGHVYLGIHILIHIAIYALFITATVALIGGELTRVVDVLMLV